MKGLVLSLVASLFVVAVFFGMKDKPHEYLEMPSRINMLQAPPETLSEKSNLKWISQEKLQKIIAQEDGTLEKLRNITEAENEIARDDVIAKLNDDLTDASKRTRLFARLKEVDQLRMEKIENELKVINQEFEQLVAKQKERLVLFEIRQP